jgi:hypothetical protein
VNQEESRLRRLCGEGKSGVWIPPGLSIETLTETAKLVAWIEWQDRESGSLSIAGATINDREFVGAYQQPSGPAKYHAAHRHVRDLLARRAQKSGR